MELGPLEPRDLLKVIIHRSHVICKESRLSEFLQQTVKTHIFRIVQYSSAFWAAGIFDILVGKWTNPWHRVFNIGVSPLGRPYALC